MSDAARNYDEAEPPWEEEAEDEPRLTAEMAGPAAEMPEAEPAGPEGPSPVFKPVPRITIEAFCETGETSSVIAKASSDRRLGKAHLTVHMGGIPAACQRFTETATPNLIIVETDLGGDDLFAALEQLASVCDAGTKVIIVGHRNDVSIYREMIRQGVNEYLVAPVRALQIIESIATLYVDPDAPPIGRSIVFIGARGGVGSSTIAHNVGWAISEGVGDEVTIVDFDLPFGTAGLDFNQDPTQGIADALNAPERLDDVLLDRLLVKCSERLTLFAAPGSLDREINLNAEACDAVIDVVRASFPCVIVDLPHIWSEWTKECLMQADDIVVTATPDLASLRNAKNLFDMLKAERSNDAPPHLVMNQVGVPKRPEIPVKDFGAALETEPTLVLPFNPALFGAAANNGQMVPEVDAKNKASEGLTYLAQALAGKKEVQAAPKRSLLSFLKRGQ